LPPRPFSQRSTSRRPAPTAPDPETWHYPLRQHNYRIFIALTLAGSGGQFLPMLVVGPLSGVCARPPLLLTMILAGLMGAFGMNGPVVLAAFADRVWHSGPAGFGLFNTVSALGALTGALLATRIKRFGRKGIVASAGLFGLSQLLAALMPTQESFVVMLVVVGFMTLLFLTSAATAVQLEAGSHVRGRVLALYFPLLLGGHAVGGLLAGWLTEEFGVRTGLVVTGGLGMASAVVVAVLLRRRSRA
jgi:MFS family permease